MNENPSQPVQDAPAPGEKNGFDLTRLLLPGSIVLALCLLLCIWLCIDIFIWPLGTRQRILMCLLLFALLLLLGLGACLWRGIYLPLLTVEPLLTYRFGRVQETVRKAVSKGLRITVGYALLLVLLGCVREWLAAGTMFGVVVSRPVLPMASMPAGGFIVLGVLCAVWRALAQKRKAYLTKEARNLVDVHSQKEADREQ